MTAPDARLEAAAEIIYNAFPFDGNLARATKPAWIPSGNSLMQDKARAAAREILSLSIPANGRAHRPPIQQMPFQLPPLPQAPQMGCICPPTSEKTCENPICPRKNHLSATGKISMTPPNRAKGDV